MESDKNIISKELHINDILRVLFYRKELFITVTIIAFIGVCIFKYTRTPLSQSETTIIVSEDASNSKNQTLSLVSNALKPDGLNNNFLQTQIEIIKSSKVIDKAADLINNKISKKIGRFVSTQELKSNLVVEHNPETNIISIKASHPETYIAKLIPLAIAKAFIKYDLEERYKLEEDISKTMEQKLIPTKKALDESITKLIDFKKQNPSISVDESKEESPLFKKHKELTGKLNQVISEKIVAETTYNFYKDKKAGQAAIESPSYQRLKDELFKSNETLARYKTKFGKNHPEMIQLTNHISQIEENLSKEYDIYVAELHSKYQATLAIEKSIEQALEELKSEIFGANNNNTEYRQLAGEVQYNQKIYELMLKSTKEAELSKFMLKPNFKILDSAILKRAGFSHIKIFLFAIIIALIIAFGAVLLMEYFDRSIKDYQTITQKTGLPIFGIVPDISTTYVIKNKNNFFRYNNNKTHEYAA